MTKARIIFLHHSTGNVVWNGGVPEWIDAYNDRNGTRYAIEERPYPAGGYPWANYPYDYWNIWVKNAGPEPFRGQDTLEILTETYDLIVFKHCFPVSAMEPDTKEGDVASSVHSLESYKLQYRALRDKLLLFPDSRFLLWTGAALVEGGTDESSALLAQEFFRWVRQEWIKTGDNIFLWDFWELQTAGGRYLLDEHAASPYDSHPNANFAARVAPLLGQRIVDVLEGRGDQGSITGE